MENPDISDRAADWVARVESGGASKELLEELERWLAEDPRHRGAYLRAAAVWKMLDRARALSTPTAVRPRLSRRWVISGSLAAGIAIVAAIGIVAGMAPSEEVYRAANNERRHIKLEDGSVLALNSGSEVAVGMSRHARRLRLNGEAWFQVAKDRRRPFTVQGNGFAVTAVGTAFSVSSTAGGSDVMVTEGVVRLQAGEQRAAPMELAAGKAASIDRLGKLRIKAISIAEMDRILAWREGRVALDGGKLVDAVAIFNRYNAQKIRIQSEEIGQSRVVGWFSIDDPESFARATGETLGVSVRIEPDEIVLSERF